MDLERLRQGMEPDHKLNITFRNEELIVEDILCEVFLPERSTDSIKLVCFPERLQAERLARAFEFSLRGEEKDFSGEVQFIIQSEKAYFKDTMTKHWGRDFTETILVIDPMDFTVTHLLTEKGSKIPTTKKRGNLWLTPCFMIAPAKTIEQSYTGNVSVKTVRDFSFTLENGVALHFDKHFRHIENESGDTLTFSELVAEVEIEKDSCDMKLLLDCLDDFLMLVSFASRQRCVCIGWDLLDSSSFTKFYRKNITVPKIQKDHTIEDALIHIKYFKDFIDSAYKNFIEIDQKDLVRQAIHRVIPKDGSTLPSDYISLYSAIETLVLFFRQQHSLDPILCSNQWQSFRNDLEGFIKQHPLFANEKEKRRFIYEKIPELNRVSFATTFNAFCENYSINLEDLWPVTDRSGGITLSDIRNKIVHGDTFGRIQETALIGAMEHLRWVAERIILAILKWPAEKSHVNRKSLFIMTCYNELEKDREALSS